MVFKIHDLDDMVVTAEACVTYSEAALESQPLSRVNDAFTSVENKSGALPIQVKIVNTNRSEIGKLNLLSQVVKEGDTYTFTAQIQSVTYWPMNPPFEALNSKVRVTYIARKNKQSEVTLEKLSN